MLEGVSGASRIPELRRRLLFTAAMLAVYRIGVSVPTPGIDGQALASFFDPASRRCSAMSIFFPAARFERFSVFALGIMPYISVAIILDLLKIGWPYLDELYKEGEAGRRKISQYTRYGTVGLAIIQGTMIAYSLESIQAPGGGTIVYHPGPRVYRDDGDHGHCRDDFPDVDRRADHRARRRQRDFADYHGGDRGADSERDRYHGRNSCAEGEMSIFLLILIVFVAVGGHRWNRLCRDGQRRIPIQYARRVVGRRVYGGQSSHLPLKVNTSGVIPPIFASSLLVFPATAATFCAGAQSHMRPIITPGGLIYSIIYVGLIIFFCYFYTAVTFNPVDVADNLKKHGGFIPGIRPGRFTADYIDRVLSRITLGGAIYVSAVCVLPTILIQRFNVPFYFGGTALLIVVGVALDTVAQIETHLLTRNYEGFMRRGRVKSRRGG